MQEIRSLQSFWWIGIILVLALTTLPSTLFVVVEASPILPGQTTATQRRTRKWTTTTNTDNIRLVGRNIKLPSTRRRSASSTKSYYAATLARRRQQERADQVPRRTNSKGQTRSLKFPTIRLSGITPLSIPFGLFASKSSSFRGGNPLVNNPLFLAAAGVGGLRIVGGILTSERFKRAMYFWKHAGPVVAHYKFTQWWLTISGAPLEKRDYVYESLHNRYCDSTMELVLHLKGLYVKIGQVVSSRPDFVPSQYINLFSTLHDSIPQWPVEKVLAILKESLAELGLEYDDVFEEMDPVALGSASIAQVHRAVLKSPWADEIDGKEVAVKVMHPSAKEQFSHDLQVFRWLCRVALPGWHNILNEFSRQVMTEFDFRREAKSLDQVRSNLQTTRHSREAHIPQPVHSLNTKNVLVMELIHGKKLPDWILEQLASIFGGSEDVAKSIIERKRRELIVGKENAHLLSKTDSKGRSHPLEGLDLMTRWRLLSLYRRTQRWLDLIIDIHGSQIFRDGMFNGDPHPGNIIVMPDGRLGLIDYGQTKVLTDAERLGVAKVVVALNRDDYTSSTLHESEVGQAMRELGFVTKLNDDKTLTSFAGLFFDSDVEGRERGLATPQLFFAELNKADPLVHVPDAAVFVARTSFLLRGMGTLLERQIQTSRRWSSFAIQALEAAPVP